MSDWKNVQYKDGKMRTSEGGGGGGSSTLSGLDDVNIQNATDGQVLKYDATNQKWINDDESGGGGSSHEYSETEHATGDKWVDGSDIYEKTIALTSLSSNTTNNITHNISNLGTQIDAFGYIKLVSGEQRPIPMNYWDANWSICIFECTSTTIGVWLGGSYSGNKAFSSGCLTLQYTKTTE